MSRRAQDEPVAHVLDNASSSERLNGIGAFARAIRLVE